MLIGIDASRANRDHKSGPEWYGYYVIRWLAKLDSKNQYILYTDKPLKGGLLDLTTKQYIKEEAPEGDIVKYDKKGFQVIKSPYNNFKAKILDWPFNFLWTQGRMSLEMIFNKPDLLFIPSHVLPLFHPKKTLVTLHDIGFKKISRIYGSEQMGPEDKMARKFLNLIVNIFTFGKCGCNTEDYNEWALKYTLKKAAKIIAVSKFSKEELAQVFKDNYKDGDPENKIKVIYNGYNKFLYKKIDEKEKLKVDEALNKYDIQRPYILYVGRLEKKKNIASLIEAFGIIKEKNKSIKHKLVLVGDAGFGFDEVKYMINEYNLEDEIIMPGWAEEVDLPGIYCGASLFVFPSLYEGFGIPIIQSMACGVPVAASQAASIREIAGGAVLFFSHDNPYSIAEAIERIIKDESLRKDLIEKGDVRAKDFSWEKTARETLEVINGMNNK